MVNCKDWTLEGFDEMLELESSYMFMQNVANRDDGGKVFERRNDAIELLLLERND